MTINELARRMVKVSRNRVGWSVVLIDGARKSEAAHHYYLDFPTRDLACRMAQILRRVLVAANRESKRRGGLLQQRKEAVRVVISFPPFAIFRQQFERKVPNAARKRPPQKPEVRLLRFPSIQA